MLKRCGEHASTVVTLEVQPDFTAMAADACKCLLLLLCTLDQMSAAECSAVTTSHHLLATQ